MLIDKKRIAEKDIYIFESHSTAIVPWGQLRSGRSSAPYLITLDYHSDSMEAFLLHYGKQFNGGYFNCGDAAYKKLKKQLLTKIDVRNEASLYEAASNLRNDEQIDAAIRADIIKYVFIMSYDGHGTRSREETRYTAENFGVPYIRTLLGEPLPPRPSRPYTYDVPESRMFIIDDDIEGVEHEEDSQAEDPDKVRFNLAIESSCLDKRIQIMNEMSPSIGVKNILDQDYVLDIDLDYFKTRRSIQPRDHKTFYSLIRSAQAITIATEPSYVSREKYPGEEIDSKFLLNAVLEHIGSALLF